MLVALADGNRALFRSSKRYAFDGPQASDYLPGVFCDDWTFRLRASDGRMLMIKKKALSR